MNDPNRLQNVTTLKNAYYALRHGQSEANVARIIASDPNIATVQYGLSPLGKQQAHNAGQTIVQEIQNHNYAHVRIVTSDLLRAKETAEIVREQLQTSSLSSVSLSFRFEERLRERRFGMYDGTSDDNYDIVWQHDAQYSTTAVHESVEPVDAVTRRVTELILELEQESLQDQHPSSDDTNTSNTTMIICVAHGDVLQILQTAFLKRPGSSHRSVPHLETATLRSLQLCL